MVRFIRNMSLRDFRKNAKFFVPNENKILIRNGKKIAKFSAKTKRVSLL